MAPIYPLASIRHKWQVEHTHLLSGTPLQNNTSELWALLFFLDPALFPSLEAFLDEFGTLVRAPSPPNPHQARAARAPPRGAHAVGHMLPAVPTRHAHRGRAWRWAAHAFAV
jgi:hypothetical protein